MLNTIFSIFSGIIIAIVSSWFTVRLSLNKFQKEKIWEEKLDAYKKIIESLHHLKDYMGKQEEYIIGIRNEDAIPKEDINRSIMYYKEAKEELSKYTNIGSLILSDKAVTLLKESQIKFNKDFYDHYDDVCNAWEAANCCLIELLVVARKELTQKEKKIFSVELFKKNFRKEPV